jgi:uroporphyrinogen decarboxylase
MADAVTTARSAKGLAKLERMTKTLRHREADRVPVSDFFWGSFLERWRREMGLASDTDIYRYYDLDWIVTIPNMDPHIMPFEVIEESGSHVVVRTGFGAVIRKNFADPMPFFLEFETDSLEKMAAFRFDDAWDEARFFRAGDNQIAGVGDGFVRNSLPWVETVASLHPDFPVYGSVCEAMELLWRIVGSERALLWIGLYPDEVARFVERIGAFAIELVKAQVRAADGRLDGLVSWGDVAYRRDLLISPEYWRRHFKPVVKALVDEGHGSGLPVIYHGCGNVRRILDDFAEIGVDAVNPLEAKAGLDVVDLRRRYGHTLVFCGNMDVRTWAEASEEELRRVVLTKLNAAKGGGFIFQSDHSVPANIPAANYDLVVRLVRQHGRYPLNLGEYDLEDLS